MLKNCPYYFSSNVILLSSKKSKNPVGSAFIPNIKPRHAISLTSPIPIASLPAIIPPKSVIIKKIP